MIHVWEIHPALVHFPIAFLTGGVVLDLYAAWRKRPEFYRYATGLVGAGTLALIPAAAAGLLAFFTVPAHTSEAHGWMLWHLGMNVTALLLWSSIAWTRWRTRPTPPTNAIVALGACVLAATLFSSYLGGEIVYKGGAGIDPAILSPELEAEHDHAHAHAAGVGAHTH